MQGVGDFAALGERRLSGVEEGFGRGVSVGIPRLGSLRLGFVAGVGDVYGELGGSSLGSVGWERGIEGVNVRLEGANCEGRGIIPGSKVSGLRWLRK